jgi:hypothetical protein
VGYDYDTFAILLVVGVAGVAWEVLYHALQQFRWEKDWPTGLGLLTGINEGIVAWFWSTPGSRRGSTTASREGPSCGTSPRRGW